MTQLEDRWFDVDRPVLVKIAELTHAQSTAVTAGELARALKRDPQDVMRSIRNLDGDGLLVGAKVESGAGGDWAAVVRGLTGDGLRIVRLWPTPESAVQRLVDLLESRMAAPTATDDERSKVRKALDGIVGLGPALSVEVIGEFIGAAIN